MFSSGPNYTKLKTHLRLAVNRLKLLEKKKTELAQKARKEIADYLSAGKVERAKIRVEQIIREDYLVEAMEIVEMYCDLLLTRFGLVTQMKELDEGIAEAVYSIVWVAPRLQSDVQELKVISDLFINKYGKEFGEHARTTTGNHRVSEKLMHKLAIQAPPKLLVEKYLIEIAKIYNIEYEPDPQVMKEEDRPIGLDGFLIDLSDKNNLGGPQPQPPQMGFIGYPQPPMLPPMPEPPKITPFQYPPFGGNGGGGGGGGSTASTGGPSAPPPFSYNIPPSSSTSEKKDLNINTNFIQEETNIFGPPKSPSPEDNTQNFFPDTLPPNYSTVVTNDNLQKSNKPKPQPRSKIPPNIKGSGEEKPGNSTSGKTNSPELPNLPNVPSDLPNVPGDQNNAEDEIDFDDLSRRFEELKKRK